jgi:hypothetical protein
LLEAITWARGPIRPLFNLVRSLTGPRGQGFESGYALGVSTSTLKKSAAAMAVVAK